MTPDVTHSGTGTEAESTRRMQTEQTRTLDTEALLSLLSDDYARAILRRLSEGPLSARDLIDRLEVSRPTVYRRLNRLEDAGVVETKLTIDPRGHHRQQYHVTVEKLQVTLGEGGLTVAPAF